MSKEYREWIRENQFDIETLIRTSYEDFLKQPRDHIPTWFETATFFFNLGRSYQIGKDTT